MRDDRIIRLPVFRTLVSPVAQRDWKCRFCKQVIPKGERYAHYFDRRTHEIIDYRFHMDCFRLIEAYTFAERKTQFVPSKAVKWVKNEFCTLCPEDCPPHPCKRLKAVSSIILDK